MSNRNSTSKLMFGRFINSIDAKLECPASLGLVNGVCTDCHAGFYGLNCGEKCFKMTYGLKCNFRCNCTTKLCHHIHGCLSTTTSDLEVTDSKTITSSVNFTKAKEMKQTEYHNTGFSTSSTSPAASPNKWILNYIIIMAVLVAMTIMLCLLRTRLSKCNKTTRKPHGEAFQRRVTNNSVRLTSEEHALVQNPTIEIQEDVYSEIRESQMIPRVFSLSQINTLMNGSIVVSTRNKSRSSDIYNHLYHSFSSDNVDICFESEYAHSHSVGVTRGIHTVVNPLSE